MTIFEALALTEDLNIYRNRKDLTFVRENSTPKNAVSFMSKVHQDNKLPICICYKWCWIL